LKSLPWASRITDFVEDAELGPSEAVTAIAQPQCDDSTDLRNNNEPIS